LSNRIKQNAAIFCFPDAYVKQDKVENKRTGKMKPLESTL
jgi:hypothetical protein